jgi:hypothetical protein
LPRGIKSEFGCSGCAPPYIERSSLSVTSGTRVTEGGSSKSRSSSGMATSISHTARSRL